MLWYFGMTHLLRSPWSGSFDGLLAIASDSLVLCAPYIGRGPCARVVRRLCQPESRNFSLTVLTDLSRDNILRGVTDVGALAEITRVHPTAVVRFLPSLHAKVYVADESQAIVTSGNLTDSGLCRNFEYGVVFTDSASVRAVKHDVLQYASLGSLIDQEQLDSLTTVVSELREMQQAAERSIRSRLRRAFERRLREMDDKLLQVRAAGRTGHAVFADTIVHLLRMQPMTTVELNRV